MSSDSPWSWFWASIDPCLESVLSWSWAPSTVSVPYLPTEVGAVQSCQGSLPGFQVLSWGPRWNSGKAVDRSLQAGAGGKSWWQVWPRELGLDSPVPVPRCFQETLSKMQRLRGGSASVPGSQFPRPSVRGEGMCKRGSFTVHGGGDPQFLTSRLWPFKYVSGLGEEHLPGPQHLQEAPSPSPSID